MKEGDPSFLLDEVHEFPVAAEQCEGLAARFGRQRLSQRSLFLNIDRQEFETGQQLDALLLNGNLKFFEKWIAVIGDFDPAEQLICLVPIPLRT